MNNGPAWATWLVPVASLAAKSAKMRVFRKIWQCVAELTIGQTLSEILVQGMFYLERHLAGGDSISDTVHRTRIFTVGAQQLVWAAKKAAAYYTRGGPKTWARGMLDIVKRGDRLQTVRVRAWDLPSYDRYCKIIASVLRRMRR